jgi:cellulose biosynthesis protein BcsQ
MKIGVAMIKLAILDKDAGYLKKLSNYFAEKYADKIVAYIFTDLDVALTNLELNHINVFLLNYEFESEDIKVNKNIVVGYLTETTDTVSYDDRPVVFKYQKIELIYKNIVDLYALAVPEAAGGKLLSDSDTAIITFVSASGGVGSSSCAVACAKNFAMRGKKILYLNLEHSGTTMNFFSGSNTTNFRDVILALKNKKANLQLKLQSQVQKDPSGVSFYPSPQIALDIKDLKKDEIETLLSTLKAMGEYDIIIVDTDFSFSNITLELFRLSNKIMFVSDGQEISNTKLTRAYNALEILERELNFPVLPKISLLYNKFSSKSGNVVQIAASSIGGTNKFENANSSEVIEQLSKSPIFGKILE